MKTRRGFVSNSSSTSFCIFGTEVELDYETVEDMLEKAGVSLEVHNSEYEGVYVGASPDSKRFQDDMTLGAIKASIKEDIDRALGINSRVGFIERAWYDG